MINPEEFKNCKPIEIIDKPWGRELILMRNGNMTVKLLEIHFAGQLSWQFHRKKSEILMLVSGDVEYLVNKERGKFTPNVIMPINAGVMHRFTGAPSGTLLEISHGDDADVVRVADSYGRADKPGEKT